ISEFDTSGNPTSSYNDTITIVRDTVINGETWHIASTNKESYVTSRADGIWEWDNPWNSSTAPVLLFKYPANTGDTFSVTHDSAAFPGEDQIHESKVISTSEQVFADSSNRTCYHYET